jgi:hypothetical protein
MFCSFSNEGLGNHNGINISYRNINRGLFRSCPLLLWYGISLR